MNGSLAERGWTVTAPDLLVSPPTGEFDLVSLQYPALAIGRRNDVIRALTSALALGGLMLLVGHARAMTPPRCRSTPTGRPSPCRITAPRRPRRPDRPALSISPGDCAGHTIDTMTMAPDELDNRLVLNHEYGQHGFPFEEWRWLRANQPVKMIDATNVQPFWAITKHRHITEISAQPDVFSSAAGNIILFRRDQMEAVADESNPFNQMRVIISMDPPDHRTFRKVASGFFTPRGITRLDEIVTDTATLMMNRLAEHGDQPVDFVEHVAQRHPLRVLCTILGVPEEDEDRLLELTSQLFAFDDPDVGRPGEDRAAASAELGMEFFTMFNTIIEDRRANPRDDLASLLANATLEDGEPMGLVETLGYYLIVFNAGHDTPRHSLSGAIAAFLDFPEEFARLKADPSLIKSAVEEIVRWSAPVNYMKRTALRDYQLDDVLISEGDAVAMFYGAANRDEEVFDDPDRFDVGRTPNRHLGFGWAEHYCLGAHLAKASIAALLEQMVERIDSIEPAGDRSVVSASFVHGYKTLPVRVNWST